MFELPRLENWVREQRTRRGWSQEELARRSGLSRTGIGAIETGRLVPSAAAALALATAFDCRVEDLFRLPRPATHRRSGRGRPTHALPVLAGDRGGPDAALSRRGDAAGGDPPRRDLPAGRLPGARADGPVGHPGDGLLRPGRRAARRRARAIDGRAPDRLAPLQPGGPRACSGRVWFTWPGCTWRGPAIRGERDGRQGPTRAGLSPSPRRPLGGRGHLQTLSPPPDDPRGGTRQPPLDRSRARFRCPAMSR